MWRVIQRISNENRVTAEHGDNEFYEYFKGLSSEQGVAYFDDELEEAALAFRNDYDSGCKYETREISLVEGESSIVILHKRKLFWLSVHCNLIDHQG